MLEGSDLQLTSAELQFEVSIAGQFLLRHL